MPLDSCNTIAQVQHVEENSPCCELLMLPCVAVNITHQCNPKPGVMELVFNSYDVEVSSLPIWFSYLMYQEKRLFISGDMTW